MSVKTHYSRRTWLTSDLCRHDERSCRCQSQVSTWYATQSAGMLTTTTCRATAETTYGQIFPSGCSTLTETQLATSWSAPASCCGYCAIAMPTVRLVFWAPATAASNLSTIVGNFSLSTASTVVDDGFTLSVPNVVGPCDSPADMDKYVSLGIRNLHWSCGNGIMRCRDPNLSPGRWHPYRNATLQLSRSIFRGLHQ